MFVNLNTMSNCPMDILYQIFSFLTPSDRRQAAALNKHYLGFSIQKGFWTSLSTLYGNSWSNSWPEEKKFSEIKHAGFNYFKLKFSCKKIDNLKDYIYTYYSIVQSLLPQGIIAKLNVSGLWREKQYHLNPLQPKKNPHLWTLKYLWSTCPHSNIVLEMEGTVEKTICQSANESQVFYPLKEAGQTLQQIYHHMPFKVISKLQTIMHALFMKCQEQ